MFMNILFWVLAAAAVFTLRRTRPDLTRPYRTWGYPFTPLLFILALSGVMANSLIKRPLESLAGLLLALLGIPIYFFWKRQSGNTL